VVLAAAHRKDDEIRPDNNGDFKMTNLKGAIQEAIGALRWSISNSKADGSYYPATEAAMENALEKLRAVVKAVPASFHLPLPDGRKIGLNQRIESVVDVGDAYKCAELLHTITNKS
jgi:hypothetical protein